MQEKSDAMLKKQIEELREENRQKEMDRIENDKKRKRGLKILRESGIYDAHQQLMTDICRFGMPSGDIFEYAAVKMLNYEKRL